MWATLAPYGGGDRAAPRVGGVLPAIARPARLARQLHGGRPPTAPAPSPQDLRLQAPGEPNMLSNEE
eukprot:CAMPEP_0177763290 /NCGR_PEP_ID=MMETSP0491_2-20121128/6793_1 /TAXON_ID=63592 /ORGANISM="Tetraselmis chuii, Strain PLY429" /LENGTH=66 /DNA_ID=CAMNT_0019279389 /DNA_START=621 /DNA_END=820 /DNA_ORIENTATION=+